MARRRTGGTRKAKTWGSMPSINLALVGDGTSAGGNIAFASHFTVLRMLFEYIVGPTGTITAGDQAKVTLAIGVVSTDAAALGATAFPDPAGEPEYPWLYWADHMLHFPSAGAPLEPGGGGQNAVRKTGDIRSMRIVKPRETLTWVVQYSDNAGTPPITVNLGQTRVLLAAG